MNMKTTIFILSFLFAFSTARANIRYVDPTGTIAGSTKTIQAAVNNAIDGDTIRILTGIYPEQLTIGKNIVIQGAGALSTTIVANSITTGAAVTMTAGEMMWVTITSSWDGLYISNATATNCIFSHCVSGCGANGPGAILINCISDSNSSEGFFNMNISGTTIIASNCIALLNGGSGFGETGYSGGSINCKYCDAYGNGNGNFWNGYTAVITTDCIQADPGFSPDFRLSSTSPCFGTGDPTILNLNASRSDMGYYGGPNAPLLPYATRAYNIMMNADGTIQFDMLGKVGY